MAPVPFDCPLSKSSQATPVWQPHQLNGKAILNSPKEALVYWRVGYRHLLTVDIYIEVFFPLMHGGVFYPNLLFVSLTQHL